MQTEKGVIYRNSDGTQKNLETELGLKANTTGSYPNLSVGNSTNATNATKATQDGNGNTISTYYLPKNGPDLVVGQTLSALISGKSYLDCAITATVSSGTYYFYNCTGTVTVSGTSAKVYLTNCPSLTINGKTASNWMNIWANGTAQFRPDNYSGYTITADAAGCNVEYEIELAVYESASWTFPIALKRATDAVCIIGQSESSAKDAYVTALTTSSVTLAASGSTKYPRIIVKGEVEL